MAVFLDSLFVALSMVLLWKGSDWLVDGAVRLADHFHVPQLVIGLTVVALGTSAPEFAVTIGAAVSGQTSIAISNVIGSNIFNLGFILGGVAIVQAIASSRELVFRDGAVLLLSIIVLFIFLLDSQLTRLEGLLLLSGLITYNLVLFRRQGTVNVVIKPSKRQAQDVLMVIFGIGIVILGGYLLREGAVGLARRMGLSEWVIGVTVVAAGTSAPEFATSMVASMRKHHGISAGNLIGSCIYNVLGVLGLAGVLRPMTVTHSAQVSVVMMLALVVLSIYVLHTRDRLSKREGLILVSAGLIIWILEIT